MENKNVLLIGPSGSGKTYTAKKIAENGELLFIHMNDNVSYDNIVEGTQVRATNGKLMYVPCKQKLLVYLEKAKRNLSKEYYVILDDINRSDMATVLGELVYAFQQRGAEVTLKSGTSVLVSANVWLIVTLNSSEVTYAGNSVQQEIFGKIVHLANDKEAYLNALEHVKNLSRNTLGKKEYNDLHKWIEATYDKYVAQYSVFTREYRDSADEYKIGMAYFLPTNNIPIERWNECIKHRIRHQVHPLLYKYAEDGIIKKEFIPKECINDTEYMIKPVREEHIIIHPLGEVRDYENEFEAKGTLPIGARSKANSSHSFNWEYVVISLLLDDMIKYSLVNQHDLLDLLENDAEILTFRNDITISGRTGGCLLVKDELAPEFPVRDNADGNTKGGYSYSDNYHKYSYNGKKYRMFSAWQVTNKVKCPYSISNCIETNSGTQKRHLYRTLKMLVYKYFKLYEINLNALLVQDPSNAECQKRMIQLKEDIEFVSKITDDQKYKNDPTFIDLSKNENAADFINLIRNIPTWKNMKKECGVYRIMSTNYKDIMEITNVKQMILQGPPGTSKTYGAKKFIAEQAGIIGTNWQEQLKDNQLITVEDQYVEKAPGKKVYWDLIQFHPSYTYEDFVRGISVKPLEDKKLEGTISSCKDENLQYSIVLEGDSGVEYKSVNKALGKIAALAKTAYDNDPNNCPDYYLVVDEINRANLATVFGELIYAFEYRGDGGVIRTPYEVNGDDSLVIPPNLYIIGTMNTADKSIGTIDYAIRRRFLFFKLLPDVKVVKAAIEEKNPGEDVAKAIEIKQFLAVDHLFSNFINKADYEKEDVQLGHTYFLRKDSNLTNSKEHAKLVFIYQVLPILFEYKKDGVLEYSRVNSLDDDYVWKEVMVKLVRMIEANDCDRTELYEDFYNELAMPEIEDDIAKVLSGKQDDEDV